MHGLRCWLHTRVAMSMPRCFHTLQRLVDRCTGERTLIPHLSAVTACLASDQIDEHEGAPGDRSKRTDVCRVGGLVLVSRLMPAFSQGTRHLDHKPSSTTTVTWTSLDLPVSFTRHWAGPMLWPRTDCHAVPCSSFCQSLRPFTQPHTQPRTCHGRCTAPGCLTLPETSQDSVRIQAQSCLQQCPSAPWPSSTSPSSRPSPQVRPVIQEVAEMQSRTTHEAICTDLQLAIPPPPGSIRSHRHCHTHSPSPSSSHRHSHTHTNTPTHPQGARWRTRTQAYTHTRTRTLAPRHVRTLAQACAQTRCTLNHCSCLGPSRPISTAVKILRQ